MSEFNLFAIIVIYNRKITDAPTYNEMKKIAAMRKGLFEKVFIFDNSIDEEVREWNKELVISQNDKTMQYITENKNIGLAEAYNSILTRINKESPKKNNWFLVTDQDTDITLEFLTAFSENIHDNPSIGAYVPRIFGKSHMISPLKVNRTFWGDSFDLPSVEPKGFLNDRHTAINSCSIFNVNALNKIGGFSEKFPIDYLDHHTYHQLWKNQYSCYCLDVEIKHDLSLSLLEKLNTIDIKTF
ncbi:glycosyltransferase [Bacillus albus]|uniref:glycosyltransferase n=1 Tax=Bacillus albus TaxID=2026189 RepID=UPI0032C45C96